MPRTDGVHPRPCMAPPATVFRVHSCKHTHRSLFSQTRWETCSCSQSQADRLESTHTHTCLGAHTSNLCDTSTPRLRGWEALGAYRGGWGTGVGAEARLLQDGAPRTLGWLLTQGWHDSQSHLPFHSPIMLSARIVAFLLPPDGPSAA